MEWEIGEDGKCHAFDEEATLRVPLSAVATRSSKPWRGTGIKLPEWLSVYREAKMSESNASAMVTVASTDRPIIFAASERIRLGHKYDPKYYDPYNEGIDFVSGSLEKLLKKAHPEDGWMYYAGYRFKDGDFVAAEELDVDYAKVPRYEETVDGCVAAAEFQGADDSTFSVVPPRGPRPIAVLFFNALHEFQRTWTTGDNEEYVGTDVLEELRVIRASWVAKDIAPSERVEWSPKVFAMLVARVLAKHQPDERRMATALLCLLAAIPVSKTTLTAQLAEIAEGGRDSMVSMALAKTGRVPDDTVKLIRTSLLIAATACMAKFYATDDTGDNRPFYVPISAAAESTLVARRWPTFDAFDWKSDDSFVYKVRGVGRAGLHFYLDVCALQSDLVSSQHENVRLVARHILDKKMHKHVDDVVLGDAIHCAVVLQARYVKEWLIEYVQRRPSALLVRLVHDKIARERIEGNALKFVHAHLNEHADSGERYIKFLQRSPYANPTAPW